jgi:ribosome maturation factor RimP
MNIESQIEALERKVEALFLDNPDCFLVEVQVTPGNHIKVFVDGDKGISIDTLVKYNRQLYRQIEESDLFPNGDFSLEVSSPGLDEPLKLYRQYLKNVGRHVEVVQKDGIKKEGRLIKAEGNQIVLEEEIGKNLAGKHGSKKKEMVQHTISFDIIKSTKIQVVF